MDYLEIFWQGLVVIIVVIIIYLFVSWFFKQHTQLSTMNDGKKGISVDASQLTNNKSTNFSYSTWFYVEDWNYKYGSPKVLFSRGEDPFGGWPNQAVLLGETENDLKIAMMVYPSTNQFSNMTNNPTSGEVPEKEVQIFTVRNFPLQRWVNLIVSVYNKTLDVYLDGKLVQSNLLKGVPIINTSDPVKITPDGGFEGWTTNFKYWPTPLNPQQAYDIYKDGYGGSLLGNIFNKYKVRVAFLDENVEQGSFEI